MTPNTAIRAFTSHAWLVLFAVVTCSVSFVFAVPNVARIEPRQASNQVYINDPTDMTASLNLTSFLVPISISEAHSLASPYELILDHGLPTSVIPEGYFPMQLVPGYYYDIRQKLANLLPLQVQQLSSLEVYLPFVDVLGSGKPFRRSVKSYMDQLVPALVGGVEQFHDAEVANFDPAHAAYKSVGGNSVSITVSQGIVNFIDGPGVVNTVFQSVFSRTSSSPISESTFRAINAQPYYTTAGAGCSTISLYYNYTNANPSFVSGNVQTFTPLTSVNQNYPTARGYTAAVQWVTPAMKADCRTFA